MLSIIHDELLFQAPIILNDALTEIAIEETIDAEIVQEVIFNELVAVVLESLHGAAEERWKNEQIDVRFRFNIYPIHCAIDNQCIVDKI